MLLEFFIALFLGLLAGTFTGLAPGIHINLISNFLVAFSLKINNIISPISFVVFIVAMSIAHTFFDFIPSILLGCPDTDTELSVLPGHQLLKEGEGYSAIMLTLYGSIGAIIAIMIFGFPVIYLKNFLILIYPFIKILIPGFLILISLLLISREENKFTALLVFVLTGFLGALVLNYDGLNQPLLPLLTGLFGASNIIISIKDKVNIPEQKIEKPSINSIKPFLGSLLVSPLCCFFPALGSGQAAIIGNIITKVENKGFLILIGMTNTLVMIFSFIFLFILGVTRTGSAVAIKEMINITNKEIVLILLAVVFAGFLSFLIAQKISKIMVSHISKINYTKISIVTLMILILITLSISGLIGFAVLITSTLTGIYSIQQKVRRTNMMGCLIIPTIIIYLI